MTIRDKHQALAAKYHWLITPLGTLLLGYLGIGEYQKFEKRQAAAPAAPVTVTVESTTEGHVHPFASTTHGTHMTKDAVQDMINKAVAAHQRSKQYHEFDQL